MTNDTPRTGDKCIELDGADGKVWHVVPVEFAQMLERELAAANEQAQKALHREEVALQELRKREQRSNLRRSGQAAWDELRRQLAAANERIAKLEERLELWATDDKGNRIRNDDHDGIYCRDATIRMQDERIADLQRERDALQKFKSYVHQRLDEAGIPVDPPGPHRDAGCRIGQRLDVLLAERDRFWKRTDLAEAIRDALDERDQAVEMCNEWVEHLAEIARRLGVASEPHQTHHERLAEAVTALREDAERYRWLRIERFDADLPSVQSTVVGCIGTDLTGHELDAAIDAARKGED